MGSLCLVLSSGYIRDICWRGLHGLQTLARESRRNRSDDPEAHPHDTMVQEKDIPRPGNDETTCMRRRHDHSALVFTLNVCLLSAGLTHFATLLTSRDKATWDTGCAFVVAWGGMTSYVAGLVCSCILSLELRRNGARRWEVFVVWIGIFVALALVFAVNALGTGTTSFVESLAAYVCHKGYNFPLSLATSIVQLTTNSYLAVRLVIQRMPSSPRIRDVLAAVATPSFGRAVSVIVLNLLILIPNAIEDNLLAQFVPFSIGGVLILAAFNSCRESGTSSSVLPTNTAPTFAIQGPSPTRSTRWTHSSSPPGNGLDTMELLAPGERRPALHVSVMTDRSFDSAIIGSVEEAIIATAVKHIAMATEPMAMVSPHSAPPRVESFVSRPPGLRTGHILPSQSEFAEKLEKEMAQRAPVLGPVVRPVNRDRRLRVVIYDEDESEESALDPYTPGSILGSDIIYRSPVQSYSPIANMNGQPTTERSSTFGMMAVEVPQQDSYVANQDIPDHYSAQRSFSIMTHRTGSTGSKSPKRSTRHFSITSHRNRSVEELPIVPEGIAGIAPTTPSRNSTRRSRRTTFGARPVSSSSRKTTTMHATQEPVPAVPPIPARPLLKISTTSLPVPTLELPSISPLKIHKHLPPHLRLPIPSLLPDDARPAPSSPQSAHADYRSPIHKLPIPPSPKSAHADLRPKNIINIVEPWRRIRPLPVAPVPDNVMEPPS